MSNSNRADKAMMDAAERYIASDKSDPFTRNRVMSHIRNGIATPFTRKVDKRGKEWDDYTDPRYYDASEGREKRSYMIEGKTIEYEVPAYYNIVRP